MPNWCSNAATITFRSTKARDEFVKACWTEEDSKPVPGTMFDTTEPKNLFQHYLPMPKHIGEAWYNWCLSNWGTKWSPNIGQVDEVGGNAVRVRFESAWTPPIEWLATAGAAHNWVWTLEYIELGMAFAGVATGDKDGQLTGTEYHQQDAEFQEIAEHFGIDLADYDDDDPQPTP